MDKPTPRITPDSQPFWQACHRHEWRLPFCLGCHKAHLPPGPVCPHCFSPDLEWRAAAGTGVISSWVVVHRAWLSSFADELPYNVVQVELDEGPRLTASVLPADRPLAVGQRVAVVYDDVSPTLTLPRFQLLDQAPAPNLPNGDKPCQTTP